MANGPRPYVSVVVPLYNEVDNVEELYRELTLSLDSLGRPYELVLVDDGSTDGTRKRLLELEGRDPRVRAVLLRRNFGQTAAFSAGFDAAQGAVIVTSDGDLQNDPADIPLLVNRLEAEDLDMVCGWRKERQDSLSRRLPSFFANRIISVATGVHLHDYGCSLKAMRVEVVRGLRLYGEMHRFIPAVASWMGVRLAEVPVNHRPRTRGKSKYGLGRTIRVLLDLFTVKFLLSYGTRPAHLFGKLGLLFGGSGFLILAYLSWLKLFADEAIGGRPLLQLGALLFLTGVILLCFGLLGEIVVRTYHESQGKPIYVVQERRASADREQEPALRGR
jgi:glycosyltransferase involved in cell wall biosynthesis